MRIKADIRRRPAQFIEADQCKLPVGLFLGLSSLISDFPKNISVPTYPKSILELSPSRPTEGRFAIVTNVGQGCGGRGSVLRATGLQGELKDL
jgi:hypothetical protein